MKIRLFNDKRLAKDFIAGEIVESEKALYLVALVVIQALFTMLIRSSGGDHVYRVASSFLIVLISIFGIAYCYRENLRGDGKAFVERFLCLSVPVSLKLSFLAIVVFTLYVAFQMFFRTDAALDWLESGTYPITVIFFNCAVSVGIFHRIALRIREISKSSVRAKQTDT